MITECRFNLLVCNKAFQTPLDSLTRWRYRISRTFCSTVESKIVLLAKMKKFLGKLILGNMVSSSIRKLPDAYIIAKVAQFFGQAW